MKLTIEIPELAKCPKCGLAPLVQIFFGGFVPDYCFVINCENCDSASMVDNKKDLQGAIIKESAIWNKKARGEV